MPASPACPWSPGFTRCCCRSWRSPSSVPRAIWWWRPTRPRRRSCSTRCAGMAAPASAHYMALVGMVALLTAGLLLLARIFKLGFLADFLSRTVLVGFLTGVGLQVGIAMLSDMFGVTGRTRTARCVRRGRSCRACRGPMFRRWRCPCWWRAASCSANALRRACPVAVRGGRDDRGERGVPLRRTRHRGHRSGPRRTAVDRVARRDLERNPGAAAGRRFMLRDDHRAKRRDLARLRRSAITRTTTRMPTSSGCRRRTPPPR